MQFHFFGIVFMRITPTFFVVVLATCLPLRAQANFITNGSFETGSLSGDFQSVPAGGTNITGWTVTGNSVDYSSSGVWNAADGSRSIDLNGSGNNNVPPFGPSAVQQSFATNPGTLYTVTFSLSGNPGDNGTNPLIKHLTVSAASASEDYTYDIGHTQHYTPGVPMTVSYTPETFTFTADSTTSTLNFYTPDTSGYGPIIDNVVVTPEPTCVALLAASGIGLMARRKGHGRSRR